MRWSHTFHRYWYTTCAGIHSPSRLSLPSTRSPERELIPAMHNFIVCVLTRKCWSKVDYPSIFPPIHTSTEFKKTSPSFCCCQMVALLHKIQQSLSPLCCYTGMFKRDERVGIMWTHTHAFLWELEINRNVWFPKHSRPAAPLGGGGQIRTILINNWGILRGSW